MPITFGGDPDHVSGPGFFFFFFMEFFVWIILLHQWPYLRYPLIVFLVLTVKQKLQIWVLERNRVLSSMKRIAALTLLTKLTEIQATSCCGRSRIWTARNQSTQQVSSKFTFKRDCVSLCMWFVYWIRLFYFLFFILKFHGPYKLKVF